jgi:hypothetical protein
MGGRKAGSPFNLFIGRWSLVTGHWSIFNPKIPESLNL